MPVTVNGVTPEIAAELCEFWLAQLHIADLDEYTATLFLTATSLDNGRVKFVVGVTQDPDVTAIFFGAGSMDVSMCVLDEPWESIETNPFAAVGLETISNQRAHRATMREAEIPLHVIECGRLFGQHPKTFEITDEIRRYMGKRAKTLVWDCSRADCQCPRCTRIDYTQCLSCEEQPAPGDMDTRNQCPACHERAKTEGLCSNCYCIPTMGRCCSKPKSFLPVRAEDFTMVALETCKNELYMGCGHPNPVKDNVCLECLLDYNECGMCDVCLAPVKNH